MSNSFGMVLLNEAERQKWEKRRVELSLDGEVSGLFRGWKPAGFDSSDVRVLYIGKATSGSFHEEDVESTAFNGKGSFWNFARQIAVALGSSEKDLSCIAWSNISKVSRPQTAADPSVIHRFEAEAAETLKAEIAITNPDIIVFVTNHFCDEVVEEIAASGDDAQWTKSEEESSNAAEADVWWRVRSDGTAVLWMRHPQFAKKELLNFAVNKIASLATK